MKTYFLDPFLPRFTLLEFFLDLFLPLFILLEFFFRSLFTPIYSRWIIKIQNTVLKDLCFDLQLEQESAW